MLNQWKGVLADLCEVIFACACMTNLNRPPYNPEASSYYQLARVSIGIDSVIDHPTLQAVRAIVSSSKCLRIYLLILAW